MYSLWRDNTLGLSRNNMVIRLRLWTWYGGSGISSIVNMVAW
jgi:hypothetical protein